MGLGEAGVLVGSGPWAGLHMAVPRDVKGVGQRNHVIRLAL